MNALIVDDEVDYRLLLGRVLTNRGFKVFLAANGRDALHKMRIDKMDIIITDVYMPIMDGYELHRTVRSIAGYEAVPFLFISAYEDDATHKETRDPRLDGFHKKEQPVEELLAWIRYLIGAEESPELAATPTFVPSHPYTRRYQEFGGAPVQVAEGK
jgi:DNA-binding response OmpR family regulator